MHHLPDHRLAFVPLMLTAAMACGITEPNVVDCHDDCPGVSGAGQSGTSGSGDGGQSGTGDAGRRDGGGGTSGQPTAGDAGSDAGEGGTSGTSGADGGDGGASPCGTCPETAPHCDGTTCVPCMQDEHCAEGVCENRECVACRRDADCDDPAAARCRDTTCVPCTSAAHCSHFASARLCDDGICVQCTAAESSACGRTTGGTQHVCDVLARTCTTFARRSAGLCQPCVSDQQCGEGQLCVMQRYDEVGDDPDVGPADVGWFCFWREDATNLGAPNGSCANVRPFFATRTGSVSIEGVQATVCGLRVTTCPAYSDYSAQSCAGPEDDSACGDPRFLGDGYCREAAASTYLCTTPCLGNQDCRSGATCNEAVTPFLCSL
jgi:hypothetical protein